MGIRRTFLQDGSVQEEEINDPPPPDVPGPTKEELLAKIQELLAAVAALPAD